MEHEKVKSLPKKLQKTIQGIFKIYTYLKYVLTLV